MIHAFQAYFSLTSNQINELYNYLTEDGNKTIRFRDFKELIFFLEENKKEEETKTIEINLSKNQFNFIKENVIYISKLTNPDDFMLFIESEGKEKTAIEWDKGLVIDLFNVVVDYFGEKNDHQEFLSYLNIIEKKPKQKKFEYSRRTSINIENQTVKSIGNIKGYLEVAIQEIEEVKASSPSKGVFDIFQNFLRFSDQVSSEVE